MRVVEKIPNGKMIAMDVQLLEDKVTNIKITGDFFLHPEELIDLLEKAFLDLPANISDAELSAKLNKVLKNAVLVGVTVEDLVRIFKKVVAK